jgi:hypothetical protein
MRVFYFFVADLAPVFMEYVVSECANILMSPLLPSLRYDTI